MSIANNPNTSYVHFYVVVFTQAPRSDVLLQTFPYVVFL
jgi:hypothetical protein